jgi:hypothetical protein
MGKRSLQPDTERQPSGSSSQVRGHKRRELVDVASPFPAVDDVLADPKWWQRLRGVAGLTVLVAILGVLTAVAFTAMVVLLLVAAISTVA